MPTARGKRPWIPYASAFALFFVWSNSFVASSFLLGREQGVARFDFASLTVARFALVGPLCLLGCLVFRRRESLDLLRRYPVRLPVTGLLGIPIYNLALFYGQQHGVPVPVASLTTALTPLFVTLLAAGFLGERLAPRKAIAFLVAVSGLLVIALSRAAEPVRVGEALSYPALLAVTAIAPLSWSIYSILSQPVTRIASPLLWTYLCIGFGSLPLCAALPFSGGRELLALDGAGWGALFYLAVICALLGYAVWSWLLKQLPASSVGFFTFLNPPLASLSKLALVALFPAVFVWHLTRLEALGGALALVGLAIAVWPTRSARSTSGG